MTNIYESQTLLITLALVSFIVGIYPLPNGLFNGRIFTSPTHIIYAKENTKSNNQNSEKIIEEYGAGLGKTSSRLNKNNTTIKKDSEKPNKDNESIQGQGPNRYAISTDKIIVRASWYGQEYCDKYSPACIAADGSRFNDAEFTAACDKRWKLGTVLKIEYNRKTIQVRCTDRGSFSKYGRSLDLSKASFRALAPLSKWFIKGEVK